MLRKALLSTAVVLVVAGGTVGAAYWYRNVRVPTNVAYVTEEDGKIDQIDLATMKERATGRCFSEGRGRYVRRKTSHHRG